MELQRINAQIAQRQKDDELKRKNDLETATSQLHNAENELLIESDKLESIRTPKFLRSESAREDQIRAQLQIIQSRRDEVMRLRHIVEKINTGAKYALE